MSFSPSQKENRDLSNARMIPDPSAKPNSIFLFNASLQHDLRKCGQHHQLSLGSYFCKTCISYDVCKFCASSEHKQHEILSFKSFQEARESTKEILLQQLEETLKNMKSKENEVQNRSVEIKLVKDRLKIMEEELLQSIRSQFDQLQRTFEQKYQFQQVRYQRQLDIFYNQYNRINDELRQNLMLIIDGRIQPHQFSRKDITSDIGEDVLPHFGKFRNAIEKTKRFCRELLGQIKNIQVSIQQFSDGQKVNGSIQRGKSERYDKFLKDKNLCDAEHSSSLLKTLNLIEKNQCQLPLLRKKLRT